MPSEKQYLERRENIASILQHLRLHGRKSRRQLSEDLMLSWGCVSELVSILLSQGILLEVPGDGAGKGRTPGFLTLNPDVCFLGIDIEKAGLTACVCDLLGRKVCTYTDELRYSSKEVLIDCVCRFADSILLRHDNIRGIGFAMQGIQDRSTGVWEFPAKPRIYLDFARDLQPRFALPSVMEHDPNCILYGNLKNTRERKMVLRLSQGIGAAIHTQTGFLHDALMEVGYLVVDGKRLQQVASTDALKQACGENLQSPEADAFFADMGKYLGIALGNICNLIRLDEILLCGQMAAHYSRFAPSLTAHFEKTALTACRPRLTAVGVTDAAFGAAKMAMDRFQY